MGIVSAPHPHVANTFDLSLPALVTLLGVLSAALGVWLTVVHSISRRVVAFSGGVLVGVAGFWVTPEMAAVFGWPGALIWVTAGFGALWVIDRYVHPVCPSCSHTHDHDQCVSQLHGFAAPLLLAAGIHSLLDGWSLTVARMDPSAGLGMAFLVSIGLHKIPEGLALGVIVRAALQLRWTALAGCALAEGCTIAGAVLQLFLAPYLSPAWIHALLAIAGGSFLYLGYHAVHSEYKRRGMVPAFVPALTGVAGSSVIRLLDRLFGP